MRFPPRIRLVVTMRLAPRFGLLLWTACADPSPPATAGAVPVPSATADTAAAMPPATGVASAESEDAPTPATMATAVRGTAPAAGPGEDGFTVRDSAGMAVVDNDHTRPAWPEGGAWRVSREPRVRIGSVHGDPAGQLYRVTHAQVLRDGSIAVVNSGSAQVRLYDARGAWRRTIGGAGDGPGEFRQPWLVFQLPGDSLLVFDVIAGISVFAPDGHYVRRFRPEVPAPFGQTMSPEAIGPLAGASVILRGHYPFDPSWTGYHRSRIRLLRFDLTGEYVGSLGDFDDQASVHGGGRGFRPVMMGPRAQQTTTDSSVWYGPGDSFELREIAPDGRTLRLLRLDRPARPVTQADRDAVREGLRSQAGQLGGEQALNRQLAGSEWAEVHPAHYDLKVDGHGNLWVQDYRLPRLRVPRMWSVFTPAGRYLGEVEMPAGFTVYQIGRDFVLGKWTDELDVEYVQLFTLLRPGDRSPP